MHDFILSFNFFSTSLNEWLGRMSPSGMLSVK